MKLSDLLRKAQSVKQKLEHPYTAAVIVAAGSATRMGGVDKIFAPIAKLPVICRTLAAFNNHPAIDEIVVVTRPDVMERMSRVCVAYEKVHIVVSGGASRTESVQKGLAAVSEGTQLVAVHDGARPLVPAEVITKAVAKAAKFGAAAPAIPVKDTIKVSESGAVDATPRRETLFAVQTPQVFDADLLRGALQNALEKGIPLTDDCSAVEALGMSVQLTEGSEENIKITTPLDLELAEAIVARRDKR